MDEQSLQLDELKVRNYEMMDRVWLNKEIF